MPNAYKSFVLASVAFLFPHAAAGTSEWTPTLTEVVALSDAIAIIDVIAIEESTPSARGRTTVHDVRAEFTWSIMLRECPYWPVAPAEQSTVRLVRGEHDPAFQPGRYLAFLRLQAPGQYKIITAETRDGLLPVRDGAVRLPRQWRSMLGDEASELCTVEEIRDVFAKASVPDQVQHFDASTLIDVYGINYAQNAEDSFRLTFATRGMPGASRPTTGSAYYHRVAGYCHYKPDVKRQLVALAQAPIGEFVVKGNWRSGFFEIEEVIRQDTGQAVLDVDQ